MCCVLVLQTLEEQKDSEQRVKETDSTVDSSSHDTDKDAGGNKDKDKDNKTDPANESTGNQDPQVRDENSTSTAQVETFNEECLEQNCTEGLSTKDIPTSGSLNSASGNDPEAKDTVNNIALENSSSNEAKDPDVELTKPHHDVGSMSAGDDNDSAGTEIKDNGEDGN